MYESKALGKSVTKKEVYYLSGPELVSLYNEMSGSSIKRFSTRDNGIGRIVKLFDELDSEKKTADKATKTAKATIGTKAKQCELLSLPEQKEIKPHRPNTQRGKLIKMASAKGGCSMDELSTATDWKEGTVKLVLKLINSQLGHGVAELSPGVYHVTGTPGYRKRFNFPVGEVKGHRSGTKREKVLELLLSKGGTTMEDVQQATGWTDSQAYQGIKLIHSYLGYGLKEDNDGVIRAFA